MLNIIQPGYLSILKLMYTRNESIHLREIAKETGLNENSAYRFLTKLEKNNILCSEKKGNMKVFSWKNTPRTHLIRAHFDIERCEKLPALRKTAIEYYLKHLPQQPVFAVLFGSTAKNTFTQKSDIDMLIISNERIETENAQEEAQAQSTLTVSTFQMTYTNFLQEVKLRDDPVVQSAITTGIPLINHVKYYEEITHAHKRT